MNLVGPFIGGILGGSILIFVLIDKMRSKSYAYYIVVSNLFFFIVIITLNIAVSYFYYQDKIISADHPFQVAAGHLLLDPYAIRNIATWLIIAQFTLFGFRILEKYHSGTIWGLMRGKYFSPREVPKVFMFVDLTDSTTLAERLGNITYFNLLRDFFLDVTNPILNSRGEVYQFIGDEVVISWSPQKAKTPVPHCIECFFRIDKALKERAGYYLNKYGTVPGFKAALHMGDATIGEIGVTKREIVYSGDILNTCARMLEQCKVHGQQFIISREVIDLVTPVKLHSYHLTPLGVMSLRGKTKSIELFGVHLLYDPNRPQ